MNTQEKILNFVDILKDLEDIGKKLYLESPEVWIDFSDKVGEQDLDEMVLFYATKYNAVSILKYVCDNNIIDLEKPSKNKSYPSIREHLLDVAKNYKSDDVYNFLNKNVKSSDNKATENKNEEKKTENIVDNKKHSDFMPVFLCPHCKTNILESGYKVYEEVNFAFSPESGSAKETSRIKHERVFCNKCNSNINNVTTDLLENMCSIHNCQKCGKDLIKIGINEKIKMKFNDDNNKFISKQKTYNCPSCDDELSDLQIKYFNL
ncbi:hypothetical protein [Terrisporobacter sp.]